MIKKVKNTVLWTYFINGDPNGEEIVGTFYQANCKRQIKKSLELKKRLKRGLMLEIIC